VSTSTSFEIISCSDVVESVSKSLSVDDSPFVVSISTSIGVYINSAVVEVSTRRVASANVADSPTVASIFAWVGAVGVTLSTRIDEISSVVSIFALTLEGSFVCIDPISVSLNVDDSSVVSIIALLGGDGSFAVVSMGTSTDVSITPAVVVSMSGSIDIAINSVVMELKSANVDNDSVVMSIFTLASEYGNFAFIEPMSVSANVDEYSVVVVVVV
jgi:hypothetical protein